MTNYCQIKSRENTTSLHEVISQILNRGPLFKNGTFDAKIRHIRAYSK